jgi:dCMP deaminase
MPRQSWNSYFFSIATLSSQRSTCTRRQCGAVIVKDKNLLSTGYNGAPSNIPHCTQGDCLRRALNIPSGERHEICRATHAEQNAIAQAAKHGHSIDGATIYITTSPCNICAKLIINSGIKEVIINNNDYPDNMGLTVLLEAGVSIKLIREPHEDKFILCNSCRRPMIYEHKGYVCESCKDYKNGGYPHE